MSSAKKNMVVAQSGGPTCVINSSLRGVVEAARQFDNVGTVYGACHGIEGVLKEELLDLTAQSAEEIALLRYTPVAGSIGTCRYKIKSWQNEDYDRIVDVFAAHNVGYFLYNGGNDSMDTCNKISKYMQRVGYECRVMGVPKTIDNDLFGTDHCPGFASAAKYVATSCMEIYQDARVYDTPMVCVVEIMGRHAGWLAGSAAAATYLGCGPDLIYLPETDFDVEQFLADVERLYKETGKVFVAVSEGIHDANGKLIAEYGAENAKVDSFGHKQLGGLAATLVDMIKNRLPDVKTRGIELSLLQRCAAHCASQTDVDESFAAGKAAVENAVNGVTDKMVAFERSYDAEGNYVCNLKLVDLTLCANTEKKVPREWINAAGNGLEKPYVDYLLPLLKGEVQPEKEFGLPRFAKLKKVVAGK